MRNLVLTVAIKGCHKVQTIDSVNDFTVAAADTGVTMLMVDFGGSMIVRTFNRYFDNGMGLFLVYGGLEMTSSSVMGRIWKNNQNLFSQTLSVFHFYNLTSGPRAQND